jgi:hypothetical protein
MMLLALIGCAQLARGRVSTKIFCRSSLIRTSHLRHSSSGGGLSNKDHHLFLSAAYLNKFIEAIEHVEYYAEWERDQDEIPEFTTDRLLCYLETGEGQESLDKLYENLKLLIEDSNHVNPFAATRGG